MFNIVLNVVIGLVFIFLLYSLLATSLQETAATIFHFRARTLYQGIKSMLTNTVQSNGWLMDLLKYLGVGLWVRIWDRVKYSAVPRPTASLYARFYDHPIIKNYGQNLIFKKPSYLSSENFVTILLETIKNLDPQAANNEAITLSTLQPIIATNPLIEEETRQILLLHLNEAAGDLDVFKFRLAKWYNDTMDRVSGWYKRNSQFRLLAMGVLLAITLNIDTIEISNFLSHNEKARDQLAEMGVAAAQNRNFDKSTNDTISKEVMDSIKSSINTVNVLVGIGWGDYGASDTAFRRRILADSAYYKAYVKNQTEAVAFIHKKDSTAAADTTKKVIPRSAAETEQLVQDRQFAMLYDADATGDCIRLKYVLGYRLWHWRKVLGFLITALAISLGAPFWFDLLNKFVSLRSAVKSVNSSGSTTKNNDTSSNPEIDG
ncbi:hypothetical protein [Chitinophaga sp.]|uniref:hypothetical protein n=1 Tax=Chitinophaga sp. TaxID=1869181 RepID=UPI0031DCA804